MNRERGLGDPPDRPIDRRQVLRIGGLGTLGLGLTGRLRADSAATAPRSPAPIRSCILIFYYGGPSHLDTWDMKPGSPREVRGEFRPIATRVPGIHVGEHLPH